MGCSYVARSFTRRGTRQTGEGTPWNSKQKCSKQRYADDDSWMPTWNGAFRQQCAKNPLFQFIPDSPDDLLPTSPIFIEPQRTSNKMHLSVQCKDLWITFWNRLHITVTRCYVDAAKISDVVVAEYSYKMSSYELHAYW